MPSTVFYKRECEHKARFPIGGVSSAWTCHSSKHRTSAISMTYAISWIGDVGYNSCHDRVAPALPQLASQCLLCPRGSRPRKSCSASTVARSSCQTASPTTHCITQAVLGRIAKAVPRQNLIRLELVSNQQHSRTEVGLRWTGCNNVTCAAERLGLSFCGAQAFNCRYLISNMAINAAQTCPMVKKLIFASEQGEFPRPKAHAASRS